MKLFSSLSRHILLASLFVMFTGNWAFINQVLKAYPLQNYGAFVISVWSLFFALTLLFFSVLCHGKVGKWLLALLIFGASAAGHFMDSYGAVIDSSMLTNMLQTNPSEAADLFNWKLIARLIFLGAIPAYLIIRYTKPARSLKASLVSSCALSGLAILLVVVSLLPYTRNYASFFREHKIIRFYANPTYFSYSIVKLATESFKNKTPLKLKEIGLGSVRPPDDSHRELLILVVGETARADHFSLNGYQRETNPELKKQKVLSLANVSSCGTATAVSVPCMFSQLTRADYDKGTAMAQQNVLDILARAGVNVLWRDNNSDSKGVADRIEYQDFRTKALNPNCDDECRDVGMLHGLQTYIDSKNKGDILIVLHQMGNHGPAYYKRYPKAFEKFKPVCKTNELSQCSTEEIINGYDNAILYTDYFLSQVIEFLKKNDSHFETSMFYVSDHGESLGESGIYLHGAPYAFAPEAQTHVPAVVWFGKNHDYQVTDVLSYKDKPFSHDDVFCGLLTAFELENSPCHIEKRPLKAHQERP